MPSLELKQILGIDESVSPELLQAERLTILKNMVLDANGHRFLPKKRCGWARYNANQVDTSGNILTIDDIETSTSANYLLATIGTKVKKSLSGSGTWSDVKTGLTTGKRTKFAVYDNKVIAVNNADAPFIISDATLSTVNDLALEIPDVQATSMTVSAGGDLDASSKYKYVIVYLTDTGEKSNISLPLIATTTADKTITLGTATTAPLPIPTDTRIISKILYRTEGNGEVLYQLAILDADVEVYIDSHSDDWLVLAETIDIITTPTKARCCLVHKDRLILGNISRRTVNKIFPPQEINSLTPNTSGSMDNGVYKYKYSLVDEQGIESRVSTYKEVTLSGANDGVTISLNPPFIGASTKYYTNIKTYKVYRTKAGGSIYYFDFESAIGADGFVVPSDYQDTQNDSALTVPYAEPAAVNLPNDIVWGDLYQPSNINDLNILPVYPDDGGGIVGLLDDQDGFWVIKDNAIIKIYTTSGAPENWQPYKVVENLGSDNSESIVKDGQYIYFTRAGLVYRYPDYLEIPLSDSLRTTFATFEAINYACHSKKYGWYVICATVSGGYDMAVWDNKIKTWYHFSIATADSCVEKKYGTNKGTLLIGGNAQRVVYYYESATADSDTGSTVQITTQIRTKTFTMNDGITYARLRRLLISYSKESGQNITVTITNPRTSQSKAVTISSGSGYGVLKQIIDAMTGTFLEIHQAIYLDMAGTGFNLFNGGRIEYNPVRRGYAAVV